jgi:hypothetical protein
MRDAEPFLPFRIFLRDGKSYDVPNRDFLMISRSIIDIGISRGPEIRIYDYIVRVSPLHIVRVENLENKPNGASSGSI